MDNTQLAQEVDAYVDEVWEDVVKDIAYLVEVNSVEDLEHADADAGAPFGPGPAEALNRALEIAERLDLEPHNLDGYIGYANLLGEKDAHIATIAHSDIVPLGPNWTFDPLKMTRKDGYLIGRGTADDKGPLVLSLWAAHFFARKVAQGVRLPYSLRAIIGANEETQMKDVDYYLAHEEEPLFCFSPDAWFPVIVGEKGVYNGTFTSAALPEDRVIIELEGGMAPNAVPSLAHAIVRKNIDELPQAEHITFEDAGAGTTKIVAKGIGAHASMPENSLSAFALLENYLLDNHIYATDVEKNWLEFARTLTTDYDGAAIGIATNSDKFGPLTAISGMLQTVDGHFTQTVDSRYPDTITAEEITSRLSAHAAQFGVSFAEDHHKVPFYIDPASPEIQTLLKTVREYTGYTDEPLIIGGGTYARKFTRACSFGPYYSQHESDPEWVGGEHMPDEGASEAVLKRALKIYIVAIARLMELDLG